MSTRLPKKDWINPPEYPDIPPSQGSVPGEFLVYNPETEEFYKGFNSYLGSMVPTHYIDEAISLSWQQAYDLLQRIKDSGWGIYYFKIGRVLGQRDPRFHLKKQQAELCAELEQIEKQLQTVNKQLEKLG